MTPKVQLGVIMLCHADLGIAARMARIWCDGGARIVIHIDAKAPSDAVERMKRRLSDLPNVAYSQRRKCSWGRFSLVQATQDAAALLLEKWPECTHVFLASGSCLPLRPVSDLTAFLAVHPQRDYIESVDANEVGWVIGGLNRERFTLYFPFDWRKHRKLFDWSVSLQRYLKVKRKLPRGLYPHLGSQWWCLTTTTLRAILNDPQRESFDRYFRHTWIADESYFQSLVRRHSAKIESISLTLSKFDHKGRPFTAYDDHIELLEESRSFVARKIWPGASRLFNHFPKAQDKQPDPSPSDPSRFDKVLSRAMERRIIGRPGLYMQSRFPKRDAENGKTARPYCVVQGLSDIFHDFEDWLSDHLHGDVHGHLFGPEQVEFAGRGKTGPGAISSSALLRDRDPRAFLTSLVRITDQMQIFQFSPRDNQKLNWFMATDPNAHIFVVTGAWNLPLLETDTPFDDVRRITALLQRTEMQQLEILNSVWVKARLQIWEFHDFIARPDAILGKFLQDIDPNSKPVTDLPAIRDMTGLGQHLRRLRNSGLHPQLARDQQIANAPYLLPRNQN